MTNHPSTNNGPLSGLRVLDLGRVLAAPWAAQIFADLGADVIKIERPGSGDEARLYTSAIPTADGKRSLESATYLSANRSKRSIAVDLASPMGQDVIRRLALSTDIVVENFLPGKLAKYGLGYEQLSRENSRLIYCSVTGYGQDGPSAQRPGYDAVFQAQSGMMEITGEPDTTPGGRPMKTGPSLVDVATGYNAAIGILAALHHRNATGKGQYIDICLLETALTMQSHIIQSYLVSGEQPPRLGTTGNGGHPAQTFRTRDGYIYISANQQGFYEALCRELGRADLVSDPRFKTGLDRYQNRQAWDALAAPVIAQRTSQELYEALTAARVPCSPVHTYAEALSDPQVRHREVTVEVPHPVAASGKVTLLRNPLRFSETPTRAPVRPPLLAEHSQEILAEAGFSPDEIQALRVSGAVAFSPRV